jgi:glutamine amidotransferase
MKPQIAIIDYGMGNLRSVEKALQRVGAQAGVIDSPEAAAGAKGLVLPGVGAFGQAMERLSEAGFDQLVKEWVIADRPFLGICLGLQLLFTESEEFGPVRGLDLVAGRVVRFRGPQYEQHGDKPGLKVPHMGWNSLNVTKLHAVVENLPPDAMAYFVHSYYCVPDDADWTVSRGNVFASQFHPEKSGDVGLQMLTNFVHLVDAPA